MNNLKNHAIKICIDSISECFQLSINSLELEKTKDNFKGNFTLVLFSLTKILNQSTESVGKKLGNYLIKKYSEFQSFELVGAFLNLKLSHQILNDFLNTHYNNYNFGFLKYSKKKIMIEYSSPNSNKPLHLGHIRNNFLGFSISRILQAVGNEVIKTQIINDRGIHICKSMIAWIEYSNNETPNSSNLKGDHFVGKYYLIFEEIYQKEIKELIKKGENKEKAKKNAPILLKAKDLLLKWENGDPQVQKIWKKMNTWVYEGFNISYKRLGIDFDIIQYESDTYLLGKKLIKEGLKTGIFFTKKDGSVWYNLMQDGLNEKLVLRSDGTSVYMTQDLGTAIYRIKKFSIDEIIYIVGNEQDYHFYVLFLILKRLKISNHQSFKHLSYGMVDLPDGKMKSRKGTVVDADNLIEQMYKIAKSICLNLGKLNNFNEEEKEKLYNNIGIGALKYYILKIDPKKRILFNPKESIDFNGNTGPFIQYTHARIKSLLDKSNFQIKSSKNLEFNDLEIKIILHLDNFSEIINKSASDLNPSLIANYLYNLVKMYNSFYQNNFILKEKNLEIKNTRILISSLVKITIKNALYLLGIYAPNRM